jgi:hypothetical protein
MDRTRAALLVSSILVALLAIAPAAGAKTKAALPDLVVKKVSKPPKTKTVGTKLKLVVRVANVGGAPAGRSPLGIYLGKGTKHAKKDKRLKRVKVKPLAAGKTRKVKLRFVLPATTKLGSYHLFACADDTKKLKEAKERNCKGTRKIRLLAKPVPIPPEAAAFSMSDGIDWGFVQNGDGGDVEAGTPITLALTAGNGIPGQAGYRRTAIGAEGFRTGNATTLTFEGTNNDDDDGHVTRQLPFAFPFGGIKEQSISVSTNGWVSFGAPAWDYWDDSQPNDYRGIPAVVGEFYRGLMPYWADLNLDQPSDGSGSVKEVVAPDNSWVAFQWDTNEYKDETRRSFQVVLFPDGSFRFDYPGTNMPGGNASFVGYSLGTGSSAGDFPAGIAPPSGDVVSAGEKTVPSSSLLFTPNAVPAAGPTSNGEIAATLPKGSSFVSADAGCSLVSAPAQFSIGIVSCQVAALAPGEQTSRSVTFSMLENAPGESVPANVRVTGNYSQSGSKLTDGDEIDRLTTNLESTTINIEEKFTGVGPEPGTQTSFESIIKAGSGLDEPSATFEFKNATIAAVEIDGKVIECTGVGSSTAYCLLPSGISNTAVKLTIDPTDPGAVEFRTAAWAFNAPEASLGIGVSP